MDGVTSAGQHTAVSSVLSHNRTSCSRAALTVAVRSAAVPRERRSVCTALIGCHYSISCPKETSHPKGVQLLVPLFPPARPERSWLYPYIRNLLPANGRLAPQHDVAHTASNCPCHWRPLTGYALINAAAAC